MNKKFRNIFITVFLVAMTACVPAITRPKPELYTLHISENSKSNRFDILLKSSDSKAMCVSTNSWPNSSGKFTVEMEGVFVESSSGVLPVKSKLRSAYCPGGCGEHRIEAKGELRGFISYDVFDDAEKLAMDSNKILVFKVFPYYCR